MSFHDRRAAGLLTRVRDDVSSLGSNVGSLLTHTTRHTIPHGARELADSAYHQLSAGRDYAASRLRSLRARPAAPALGWIGGAILVGVIAAGAYAFFRSNCEKSAEEELEDELDQDIPV
jgi:hypothetical protein